MAPKSKDNHSIVKRCDSPFFDSTGCSNFLSQCGRTPNFDIVRVVRLAVYDVVRQTKIYFCSLYDNKLGIGEIGRIK